MYAGQVKVSFINKTLTFIKKLLHSCALITCGIIVCVLVGEEWVGVQGKLNCSDAGVFVCVRRGVGAGGFISI